MHLLHGEEGSRDQGVERPPSVIRQQLQRGDAGTCTQSMMAENMKHDACMTFGISIDDPMPYVAPAGSALYAPVQFSVWLRRLPFAS